MYRDPTCKPWTSRSWAPPGYASRKEAEAEMDDKQPLAKAVVAEHGVHEYEVRRDLTPEGKEA